MSLLKNEFHKTYFTKQYAWKNGILKRIQTSATYIIYNLNNVAIILHGFEETNIITYDNH
jgi:hypothetical protein